MSIATAATTERRRQLVAAANAYFSGLVQKDVSRRDGQRHGGSVADGEIVERPEWTRTVVLSASQ